MSVRVGRVRRPPHPPPLSLSSAPPPARGTQIGPAGPNHRRRCPQRARARRPPSSRLPACRSCAGHRRHHRKTPAPPPNLPAGRRPSPELAGAALRCRLGRLLLHAPPHSFAGARRPPPPPCSPSALLRRSRAPRRLELASSPSVRSPSFAGCRHATLAGARATPLEFFLELAGATPPDPEKAGSDPPLPRSKHPCPDPDPSVPYHFVPV